jgi:lipopolysaccharide transport system permease protein
VATLPEIRSRPAPGYRRIQPSRGFIPIDFGELWRYRGLLVNLLKRDVKARYKQTFLGPIWAVLRPFISMVLMAAIFGGLAGFKSGSSVPYPLFLYAGLLVWSYFSSALTGVTSTLLSNAPLLGKAYFPRIYAPLSSVATPLVDFGLSFTILLALFPYYHRWPSWHIIFLPFFVLLALLAALGVGLWLCGAAVKYRDLAFAMPFLIQLLFYATPVLYSIGRVPAKYRPLLALNPLTSVIDGFRWSLLGVSAPHVGVLLISSGLALVLVVGGLFFYRRTERTIADML